MNEVIMTVTQKYAGGIMGEPYEFKYSITRHPNGYQYNGDREDRKNGETGCLESTILKIIETIKKHWDHYGIRSVEVEVISCNEEEARMIRKMLNDSTKGML